MKEFDINTHRIRAVFMWAVSRNDRGGSDRSNAIDIMSMIHLQLKKIVRSFLFNENKPLDEDSLLGANAPLGNFYNTLLFAYRLNRIPEAIYKDLKIMNKIRNLFAHDLYDFSDAEIKDRVNGLQTLKFLKKTQTKIDICKRNKIKIPGVKGVKLDFLWVASYLSLRIDQLNNTTLFVKTK